jgi:AcrR family transcriptional regulator
MAKSRSGKPSRAGTSKSDRTRLQILEGSIACFVKRGFDGSSVSELSKSAGVNQGLFHYYFGNKETLMRECLMYVGMSGRDFTEAGMSQARPSLENYLRVTFRWKERNPGHSSFFSLCIQRASYDRDFNKLLTAVFGAAHLRLASLIRLEAGLAELEDKAAMGLARAVHSTLVGMIFMAGLQPDSKITEYEEDCVSAVRAMTTVAGKKLHK